MKDSFRQRMAWLHTWCGLACGWLLCAIFLTGTLSVFREPITRWMQAQPALPASTEAIVLTQAEVLQRAARYLAATAPDASLWGMDMPQHEGDAIHLWQAGSRSPAIRQAAMDPRTGTLLPVPWGRHTEGGRHFMAFHYSLEAGLAGFWVVGAMAMGMLVALVSGVVVHKRIFQDFFTFRPGKGQRSWLDAHNATAVLALPFLFMIVYTGLAIFYTSYVPLPLHAAYGWDDNAFSRFQGELSPETPLLRPRTGKAAAMHDLAPLLRQARALTGSPASRLIVERPADTSMVIKILGRTPDTGTSRRILNEAGSVTFDGVTGAVLDVKRPDPADAHSAKDIHRVMEQLHLVGFGGWTMKWLYFFSGLSGTAMMATGTLLFTIKRRKKSEHEFGTFTARVYRGIEALNVAAIAGLCIACIAYLYGNRLIPADLPDRATWEIRIFFYAWLATLLHAMIRPPVRAWMAQLSAGALLCLGLPLLNALSTAEQAWTYASRADWERAGVELTVIGFGLALAFSAWQVRRGWSGRATPAVKT